MTTTPPEDTSALFMEPLAGPAQNVKYRQGIVVFFDQVTLDNEILVGGSPMVNLPILGVGEATLLVPGAVVGIMVVGDDDHAKTMFILGRSVVPGTQDAKNAVSLLNSQIFSDFILTGESTSSTSYTDLATVGPRVTVPVGPSGRILIIATAQIQWNGSAAAHPRHGGLFDVAFTGANVRNPVTVSDPLVGLIVVDEVVSAGTLTIVHIVSITAQGIFGELNPGATTITMKYASTGAATTPPDFHRRALTVIKL